MTTEQLIIKVQEWAEARNIINGCPPIKQAYKTLEECGELIEAVSHMTEGRRMLEHHDSNIIDLDIPLSAVKDAIGDIAVTLIIQCAMQGIDFVECLAGAYEVIKDRKGKLIDGKFVKEI